MYLRAAHATFELPTLYEFLRCNPLGVLTTAIPHPSIATIQASHLPWILDVPAEYHENSDSPEDHDASKVAAAGKPLGVLRGHMARANPQTKALIAAAKAVANSGDALPDGPVTLPDEVYVLFTGPVSQYITPKFYTTTKPATGKVVPTWNYEAVQAYGRITVYPSTTSDAAGAFLHRAVDDLSHQSEVSMGYDGLAGNPTEWHMDEAPDSFIEMQKKGIMGISVEMTHLGGKFKMSQERPLGDKEGVIAGFQDRGNDAVAERIKQLSNM